MATFYAWSRFAKKSNEWGRITEWIEPGAEITQSDINAGDDEWQALIDAGAVRETPYPDVNDQTSPAEFFRANPDQAPEDVKPATVTLKVEDVGQEPTTVTSSDETTANTTATEEGSKPAWSK